MKDKHLPFYINNLLVTCEHGGNDIPPEFRDLFAPYSALLQTHQGYDIGALEVAKEIAVQSGARHFFSTNSRLFVDLNRSLHHWNLFSFITKALPLSKRNQILQEHYFPFREPVESSARELVDQGIVLHLSIHSFTPVLNGETRLGDIGFLYDPQRVMEKQFCEQWRCDLLLQNPSLRVRANYPYRGRADSFTTYLRKILPSNRYLGVELEINQKFCVGNTVDKTVEKSLLQSLFNHAFVMR